MYAVIDIETTGGNTQQDAIIEIAILQHDGKEITGSWSTLIHPQRRIPFRITELTGIDKRMVADSPKFYEVARTIVEMTEGRTIVAHNAKFDYQFIRNAFKALAFDFKREQLCILALARQLVPGLKSYRLGHVCTALDIPFHLSHRALADAESAAHLLTRLLEIRTQKALDETKPLVTRTSPEAALMKDRIDELPHTTGVYYFFNARHDLIYIGKSVDIRSRVLSHFSNHTTTKALEMRSQIRHIRFEETGSELVALLKESEEIKRYQPRFNRAQRRTEYRAGLHSTVDEAGYIDFWVERYRKKGPQPVAAFATMKGARGFLERMMEEFQLCQSHCGMHRMQGACFHYNIKKCLGACVNEESPEDYNLRASQVLDRLKMAHQNMMIVDRGRHEGEKSLVGIENGKYLGYGFVEEELLGNEVAMLKHCLDPKMDNRDVRQIIGLYLRQEKAEKVLQW